MFSTIREAEAISPMRRPGLRSEIANGWPVFRFGRIFILQNGSILVIDGGTSART